MTAPFSPQKHFFACFALALTMGLLGCEKATSSGGSPDASAADTPKGSGGAGGTTSGTGGATTGTGGQTAGTGGATSGTGGLTAGTGGATSGTGGRTTGSGGSTAGTGGSGADGGADAPTVRTDGSAGQDAAADTPQRRDGAPDAGPAQNDAPLADAPANTGDGGINVPDGYKLVWSDEFDVDGTPNSKNWNYEKGFVRNNELQWYQSNNASVKGGLLIIEGRKEQVANPNYSAGSSDWKTSRQYADYTSTSMTTSGLQSWQYGRFEMRGRIPTTSGMWPAWWTLGVSGEWPSNGEIDIMEFYKGNVLANVACGTSTRWTAKWDSSTKAISSLGSGWSSSFHVWRMDWDDQKIDLYLDDTLLNSVTLSSMLNSDGTSPFKQKVYMILNLAIGGDSGGDPSGTTFPVQYEVDYVRVFQKL
jgi:beta-glucanase (GH16 family)